MSAVLSEAENKFFQSGGTEVDSSLGTPSEPQSTPDTPPSEPKPAESAPPAAPTPPKAAETPQPKTDESRVPLEALHAERDRRRQMEQQLQQMQQQWNQLQQALQAQSPQEQRPDPQQDPYGALEYDNRQMRAQLEQFTQRFTQQEQAQQQQAQVQRLTQHLTASEQAFAKSTPDYFKAADFALERENLRLQAFYPDPAIRQQVLRQEIANVVAQAIQTGTNPAEIIYQHAKNLGYAAQSPAAAPAAPVVPAAPAEVPEAVQKIQKGLKQQTNLSAGGSTPPSELTPEMGANLSGKEFDKFWDQMKRSARR